MLNVTYYPNYFRTENRFYYSAKIIYPIGDFQYLFNFYPYWSVTCDFNYSGGLRCYEDSEFGYYSTKIADSCTYVYVWAGIENVNNNKPKIDIFPNPTQDKINVICHDNTNYQISLFDNLGKILNTQFFKGNANLDISSFPKGIYFIQIRSENGLTRNSKILKK